jgi:nitronate monooxygenase
MPPGSWFRGGVLSAVLLVHSCLGSLADVGARMTQFKIIQGGMGVGVSNWRLARAVASLGQLGVVSGTGLPVVLARRLQNGDPGGHMRRAMQQFPVPGVAGRVLDRYFVAVGKPPHKPFKSTPLPDLDAGTDAMALTVLANFVEVFLAKEGLGGKVGINYLEKIQIPTLPSLFGAMLAGVDVVLMGAGIPRFIPGALDALALGRPADLRLDVDDAVPGESFVARFDPAEFCGGTAVALRRPDFLAIVSSATLAMTLARKSNGRVDGFVVEGATAGGHNAPPRGPMQLNARGEPLYGPRDDADISKIRELSLPFWLAGGCADAAKLAWALAQGASGVQVGTAFAFCEESGIDPRLKARVISDSLAGRADVFTDPAASPTGFPFKIVQLSGTLSDDAVFQRRQRICDLGYLRRPYRRGDGTLGYRCPGEPEDIYLQKGGTADETIGRKCLCNALFANIGLGQMREGGQEEPPMLTAGDDVKNLSRFVAPGRQSYTAAEVVQVLLGGPV